MSVLNYIVGNVEIINSVETIAC